MKINPSISFLLQLQINLIQKMKACPDFKAKHFANSEAQNRVIAFMKILGVKEQLTER